MRLISTASYPQIFSTFKHDAFLIILRPQIFYHKWDEGYDKKGSKVRTNDYSSDSPSRQFAH